MNEVADQVFRPIIVKRKRGGFLAISDRCMPIRIGVIAETPDEAREKFAALVGDWLRDRAAEPQPAEPK